MTVEWLVPPGETRSITTALHSLMTAARSSHGCISCSMSTDIADRGTVRYIEEWQTEDDLRRRLQPETFTPLASLIDEATGLARVEFDLPRGKRGLEFVEESRRPVGLR
jgi:quinol monooxygenase YgiN